MPPSKLGESVDKILTLFDTAIENDQMVAKEKTKKETRAEMKAEIRIIFRKLQTPERHGGVPMGIEEARQKIEDFFSELAPASAGEMEN